jgi:TolA-binding protein
MSGCSLNTAKKHYVLAEELWQEGNYQAAVAEFDKVTAKDPRGRLGQQALFRAATTEALFLSHYPEALKKFKIFAESSPDASAVWEAQKEIGELLFSKMEQYDQAVAHYRSLIQQKPGAPETPDFLYRIGKSEFFLWHFDDAIKTYEELHRRFGQTPSGEKALFEVGVCQFTRGEQSVGGRGPGMDTYRDAIEAYERFIKTYPRSALVSQARFGIASALEELDQIDAAYQGYEALKDSYPDRNVIEIKLARIRDRRAQRSH